MTAISRRSGLVQLARGFRERRALRSALDTAKSLSSSLSAVNLALELATQRKPSPPELSAWTAIERRRNALLARTDIVRQLDFGAGSRENLRSAQEQNAGVFRTMSVSELAAASSDSVWGEFLYFITRASKPKAVLELGSCVGISAGYISAALEMNDRGHLWTLEGSPESARLAGETLQTLERADRGTVVVGRFDDTLQECLANNGPFDLAFIDGHHDGEATVRYFDQIKQYAAPDAILIFDDVHFSPSMEAAWQAIASHPDTKGHVRIRARGVIVV
jgi:predicted O-methyltransferase YrrM